MSDTSPADSGPGPSPRRLRLRRRLLAAGVAAVVVAGAVLGGLALWGGSSPQYRTVPAEIGTVTQTTTLTGTIEPVTQADLNFATSGTVASVPVKVGDKVTAGTVVATLESTGLAAQVDQARAALDTSRATLASALAAGSSPVATDRATVASDQAALADATTTLDDDQASDQLALTDANEALASAQSSLAVDSLQMANDQSTFSAAQAKASADCQGDALAGSATCEADQGTVSADQSRVTADQASVAGDRDAVRQAEDSLTTTQLKNSQTLQQDRQQVSTDRTQLSAALSALQQASDGTYPAQIASDRASVAMAESNLQSAQQTLSGARLVSPIAGTVIAVNVVTGGAASSGATIVGSPTSADSGTTSASVEVESPGTFEVHATASDAQVATMKVGDFALITPTGGVNVVPGTVTQVGTIASVSSSGVVSFPVTIGVTGPTTGLYEGVSAQLLLTVLEVKNVLTVPTSAVHTNGPHSFVDLLRAGKEVVQPVSVGAVGSILTQITHGLTRGEPVVLADLSAGISSPGKNLGSRSPGGKTFIGPGGGVVHIQQGPGPNGFQSNSVG